MPIEYWILCLLAITFFGGWISKIAWEQYKADCEREARAEERRQAYERDKAYIKQINRRILFVSWCEEAKGGVRK
jgi:hypothetical protein